MPRSSALLPWAVASALVATSALALLLTLLAMHTLWRDVDRIVAGALGLALPWTLLLVSLAAAAALLFSLRAASFLGFLGEAAAPPGVAGALFHAVAFTVFGGLVFGLFTQASDAVLVAELQAVSESMLGPRAEASLPARDVGPGERFEESVLFDGDADARYATYRIPGVVVTPAGVVLAYCEARATYGDWADIDLVLKRSPDGGETWEPMTVLTDDGAGTVNNAVMIAEHASETVHLVYALDYARAFHRRSDDAGRSWTPPREVTAAFEPLRAVYPWRVLAPGPGHGIQLRSGRLLVPVWLSPGGGHDGHHPQQVATIYSDDGGVTWQAGKLVTPPDGADHGEPVAAELSDGRVMLNMRNEDLRLGAVYRAVSTSPDGARDWSPVRLDPALPDPISFGALHRVDARTLVFANVHRSVAADWRLGVFGYRGRREPLGIRLSFDDGATWPAARILHRQEGGYVDVFAHGGTIYALYEQGWRRRNQYRTRFLRLARFDLPWARGGGS